MKKILKNCLILFIFCLTFTLGGIFNLHTNFTSAAADNAVEISSVEELVQRINSYGVAGVGFLPTDSIVLKDDIDFAKYNDGGTIKQYVLKNVIGTSEKPFSGTFDGNGFKILNLQIEIEPQLDASNALQSNQYAGLFGYVNGATIKNFTVSNMKIDSRTNLTSFSSSTNNQFAGLVGYAKNATIEKIQLLGTSEIVVGGYKFEDTTKTATFAANNIFAGTLAGKLENSDASMIQSTSTVKFNPTFDTNINFGGLLGSAVDSKISYINSKNEAYFGNWSFTNYDGKIFNLGGLAGTLSNVRANFVATVKKFNLSVSEDFIGTINLGGFAGTINQGNTQIYNIAIENSYSISNNNDDLNSVNVGEIAGRIGTPSPQSGNLSYVHYKNNGLSKFGNIGSYAYKNAEENDFIKPSPSLYLNALESSNPSYFTNQDWHPLYGEWDFDSIWYVGGQTIKLQCFYGDFKVKYLDNSDVVAMTTQDFVESYNYGDSAVMDFEFKNVGSDVSMKDFYNLSHINLYENKIATINQVETESGTTYSISDCDYIDIVATENGFQLVIEDINLSTAGQYSVSTYAKTFEASITSKLYKESADGESEELVDGTTPGYVYYADAGTTTSTEVSLENMSYGREFRLRTREIPNSPYLFQKWILIDAEGNEYEIGTNKVLEINFGSGLYVGNFDIYAKYLDNAQVISFILDDGIARIELNNATEIIDKSGQSSAVSKSESAFKMEIFVEEGYEFNVEDFVKTLNTYKSVDSSEQFCVLSENASDESKYTFILNMTVLNKDDFGETFEIKAQTMQQEKENNSWIWIVVGVGGGLVLIALVILIIWLVRRNRFGGIGGGSFKSYKKGMYF